MVYNYRNSLTLAICLFFLSLTYYGVTAGNHQIFTRGEGREAIVVQSMLSSKDFVLPFRNGTEIPSKPPLFHWVSSAVASLDGKLSELDARSPSVIATAITLAFGFLFYTKALGTTFSLALLSLLTFASSFESMRSSAHGRVDALFAATISLSCFSLFLLLDTTKHKEKLRAIAVTICTTITLILAGLAKGPAGILIPGFIATTYTAIIYWSDRNRSELISRILLLTFCGIISSLGLAVWYYSAYQQHGDAFLQVQLYDENLARLFHLKTSGAYSENLGHKKPFYFSPLYLIVGFLPWSVFFPTYIALLFKRIKEKRIFEDKYYLFALIWVVTFLIAVTISSSKRSVYFLPCYPALAYLFAIELTSISTRSFFISQTSKVIKGFSIFLSLVSISALVTSLSNDLSFKVLTLFKTNPLILPTIESWRTTISAALIIILIATTLIHRSGKELSAANLIKAISFLGIAALLTNLTISKTISPLLSDIHSPKLFIKQISEITKDQPLYQYKDNFYAAMFYAKRPIPVLRNAKQLADKSGYLLVSKKQLEEATTKGNFKFVGTSSNLSANQKAPLVLLKFEDSQ